MCAAITLGDSRFPFQSRTPYPSPEVQLEEIDYAGDRLFQDPAHISLQVLEKASESATTPQWRIYLIRVMF